MGVKGLTLCCMTHLGAEDTAEVLAPWRTVADAIVLGVDERRGPDLEPYRQLASTVLRLQSRPVEHHLDALHRACASPWILRVDTDELPSSALLRALPALVARQDVDRYAIARRWVVNGGEDLLDERPWWPDYQVRLTRREHARFVPEVHAGPPGGSRLAWVVEPLLHLDLVTSSRLARVEKVLRYEVVERGGGDLGGQTARIYHPELYASRPLVATPPEDRERVVGALRRRRTPAAAVLDLPVGPARDPSWRSVPGDPERPRSRWARLELLERDLRFVPATGRTLSVRVRNCSNRTWDAEGGFSLSYRWHRPGRAVAEGPRSPLPHPIRPGATCVVQVHVAGPAEPGPATLVLGVVEEGVDWHLDARGLDVLVTGDPWLRSCREVRPGGPAIPRTVHRVWLGGGPLPAYAASTEESWRTQHPDWQVRLWTDDDLPYVPGIERARNLAERADLARYAIVRAHGGLYADVDVTCLRPFDDLLAGVQAFAGYEVPGRLCNAVFGAVPEHPAIVAASELAAVTVGHGTYPEATATSFLTTVLDAFDDVTLFGPERFYPELWDGRRTAGPDAPHTRHGWAREWATICDS